MGVISGFAGMKFSGSINKNGIISVRKHKIINLIIIPMMSFQ
jgi:hypothetical protein